MTETQNLWVIFVEIYGKKLGTNLNSVQHTTQKLMGNKGGKSKFGKYFKVSGR